jgi:hypothetical protein
MRDKDTFTVTEKHLKLLRKVYISWDDCEFGAPCIDPKRPYGNRFVYGDIAEILGIEPDDHDEDEDEDGEFTEKQEEMMMQLHMETQTVLQIALATGRFETGKYEAEQYTNKWTKICEVTSLKEKE